MQSPINNKDINGAKNGKTGVDKIPVLTFNLQSKQTNITAVKEALGKYCQLNYIYIRNCIDQDSVTTIPTPSKQNLRSQLAAGEGISMEEIWAVILGKFATDDTAATLASELARMGHRQLDQDALGSEAEEDDDDESDSHIGTTTRSRAKASSGQQRSTPSTTQTSPPTSSSTSQETHMRLSAMKVATIRDLEQSVNETYKDRMREVGKQERERTKELIKLFGLIMNILSDTSHHLVTNSPEFSALDAESDGFKLWQHVVKLHTAGTCAENDIRKQDRVERTYSTMRKSPKESLHDYHRRFKEAVKSMVEIKHVISEPRLAWRFMDSSDGELLQPWVPNPHNSSKSV
jgi:hypothetical protein